MFSTATRAYFEHLPELPGLEATEARRVLSAAYADVLAARDGFAREAGSAASEVANFLRRLAGALESYAVFPDDVSAEERHAAAFIAAESLSLTRRVDEAAEVGLEDDDGPVDEGADQVPEPTYRLLRRST